MSSAKFNPSEVEKYIQRCKRVGRLGPPKTELDRNSVYGDCTFGRDRLSNSAYNN